MKWLTFRERNSVEIGPDGDLTDTESDGLGLLAQRLPNGALTWGHRTVRFGPFCGVIRTSLVTIELLPKVERGPQDAETMRGLLVAMLARAGELGLKRVGVADLGHQSRHLLDVFI